MYIYSFIYLVPTSWIVLNSYVCYGGKDENYGSFQFDRYGTLVALRLSHLSGNIRFQDTIIVSKTGCRNVYSREASGEGNGQANKTCEQTNYCQGFSTFVTNVHREIIFPNSPPYSCLIVKMHLYDLPGYRIPS